MTASTRPGSPRPAAASPTTTASNQGPAQSPWRGRSALDRLRARRPMRAGAAARIELQRRLRQDPDDLEALHDLALLLQRLGDSSAAIAQMRRLAERLPDDPRVLNNLGNLCLDAGDGPGALRAYRQALVQAPDWTLLLLNYAVALNDTGAPTAAGEVLQRARQIDPQDAGLWIETGNQALRLRDTRAADTAFRQALRLAPSAADAWSGLGAVAMIRGQRRRARRCFGRALRHHPGHPLAVLQLARARSDAAPGPGEIAAVETALARETARDARATLHFALGHLHERSGHARAGFEQFLRANRLVRPIPAFDPAGFARQVEALIDLFQDLPGGAGSPPPATATLPVFVVGPPRSGTSLVEQILCSHPAAGGVGESTLLRQLLCEATGPQAADLATRLRRLDPGQMQPLAGTYLRQLRAQCPDARRIIDKGFLTGLHLGLAACLFPWAPLIEIRRDPLDAGWSLFTERFAQGLLPFAYDLRHIGSFLHHFERLMAHWRRILGGRLLSLSYAELVTEPRACVARMLAHCGLPWDDHCLDFHQTRREVHTASAWQVREPLYTRALDRSGPYRAWLGDLRAALESGRVE